MTKRVQFTEDGARRIVAATRAYERGSRDQPPIRFRQPGGDEGGAIRVGKVADAWARGTCASVAVWEGGDGCTPTETDPPTTIDDVSNMSVSVPAGSWVLIALAANGRWYLIDAGQDGECRQTIGGEDITTWPGWDGAKEQLLGHGVDGCLMWFDTTTCDSGS